MNRKNVKNAENVIVGGGIIGLLVAWYFAKAGKSTVVLDRQAVGQESSWAGGGILSPLYPSKYLSILALAQRSLRAYPDVIREVRWGGGIDPEFAFSGLLVLDPEIAAQSEGRYGGELVSGSALAAMEPHLKPPAPQGLYYKAVAQVRNPRLIAALRRTLSERGVRFLEHQTATDFLTADGTLRGLYTDEGYIEAEKCIVTAGAWTSGLVRSTGAHLPIKPMRGQMIVIKARPALISQIIVYQYRYLIPRRDGRILVGSTLEDVGFNKDTTVEARSGLWQAAVALIPNLAEYPIEHHWSGLRPGTPDGIPFIGEHPEISGLFICAGHYRNGFATGPASAELVVDLILGRQPAVDPTPYRVDRPTVPWVD